MAPMRGSLVFLIAMICLQATSLFSPMSRALAAPIEPVSTVPSAEEALAIRKAFLESVLNTTLDNGSAEEYIRSLIAPTTDTPLHDIVSIEGSVNETVVVSSASADARRLKERSNIAITSAQEVAFRTHQLYAAAAYCLYNISTWTCDQRCSGLTAGTVVTKMFATSLTDTVGFVGYNPTQRIIIVSFRGSDSVKNWIVNLSIAKIDADMNPSTPGRIHSGFNAAYNEAKSTVRSAVAALMAAYPTYEIHVTGHSLGAAVGALCAVDLAQLYPAYASSSLIKAYLYGEPRIGNSAFASYLNTLIGVTNVFRIVNYGDIVAQLPFKELGYYHHRQQYWINKNNVSVTCNELDGSDCAGSISVNSWNTADHLEGYYDAIFGPWC